MEGEQEEREKEDWKERRGREKEIETVHGKKKKAKQKSTEYAGSENKR